MSTERKEIPAEVVNMLRVSLPKEAIKPHPTKPYLSTIKTIYSIERLNDVFGLNGWIDRYEVVELQGSMIVVKGELIIPEYDIRREAYGGNDNADRGDAYKGACTDALSKMVATLYIGMDVYKGQPNAPTVPAIARPTTAPTPQTATTTTASNGNGVDVLDVVQRKGAKGPYLMVLTHNKKSLGSVFDTKLFEAVKATQGHRAEFETKTNGSYTNIIGVISIDGGQDALPNKPNAITEGFPITDDDIPFNRAEPDDRDPDFWDRLGSQDAV